MEKGLERARDTSVCSALFAWLVVVLGEKEEEEEEEEEEGGGGGGEGGGVEWSGVE